MANPDFDAPTQSYNHSRKPWEHKIQVSSHFPRDFEIKLVVPTERSHQNETTFRTLGGLTAVCTCGNYRIQFQDGIDPSEITKKVRAHFDGHPLPPLSQCTMGNGSRLLVFEVPGPKGPVHMTVDVDEATYQDGKALADYLGKIGSPHHFDSYRDMGGPDSLQSPGLFSATDVNSLIAGFSRSRGYRDKTSASTVDYPDAHEATVYYPGGQVPEDVSWTQVPEDSIIWDASQRNPAPVKKERTGDKSYVIADDEPEYNQSSYQPGMGNTALFEVPEDYPPKKTGAQLYFEKRRAESPEYQAKLKNAKEEIEDEGIILWKVSKTQGSRASSCPRSATWQSTFGAPCGWPSTPSSWRRMLRRSTTWMSRSSRRSRPGIASRASSCSSASTGIPRRAQRSGSSRTRGGTMHGVHELEGFWWGFLVPVSVAIVVGYLSLLVYVTVQKKRGKIR